MYMDLPCSNNWTAITILPFCWALQEVSFDGRLKMSTTVTLGLFLSSLNASKLKLLASNVSLSMCLIQGYLLFCVCFDL